MWGKSGPQPKSHPPYDNYSILQSTPLTSVGNSLLYTPKRCQMVEGLIQLSDSAALQCALQRGLERAEFEG
jgi:hypothetical protein